MTLVELIEAISDTTGYKKKVVSAVLDEALREMTYCLSHGESVKLKGLATFQVKSLKSRKLFGKEVPSRKVVKLKVGRKSPWRNLE